MSFFFEIIFHINSPTTIVWNYNIIVIGVVRHQRFTHSVRAPDRAPSLSSVIYRSRLFAIFCSYVNSCALFVLYVYVPCETKVCIFVCSHP
jgi:hypothetical protein